MVRRTHKYADGGKVVRTNAKPQKEPGLIGAIKGFIGSTGKAAAPKSVTQRKSKIDQAIEEAGG